MHHVFPPGPVEQLLRRLKRGLPFLCGAGGPHLLDRPAERTPLSAVDGGAGLGLALVLLGGTGTGHGILGWLKPV
jgi:hypothetical protein